jgi:site-specific recombinase XerD
MGVVMSLELLFKASRKIEKFRSGPLGDCMDEFCDWLLKQGFSHITIRKHLANVSHFKAFLGKRKRGEFRTISAKDVNAFFTAYPAQARTKGTLEPHVRRVRQSINRFVKFLQQSSRYDPQHQRPVFAGILQDYLQWMHDDRHASVSTLKSRRYYLSQFFTWLGPKIIHKRLAELNAETIEQYFLSYGETATSSARQAMGTALRTFLQFGFHKEVIPQPLTQAVPTLRCYRLATVPRALSDEQAQKVLCCVDRNTPVGRRDYAILQLLYTYGVRGAQVRHLQLADIHWSKNQILFKALKRGKDSLLPLTDDVGKSLLDYLKKARPKRVCPYVFSTSCAPYHRLDQSTTISKIVCSYIVKARIDAPSKGSHALRHCFATRMVQAGHPLKSVADVLGHRRLSTTFIYTKIDFNALKQVALPWPQEVSR